MNDATHESTEQKPLRATLNREYLSMLPVTLEVLMKPLDFTKKFRVVLEHDPEKSHVDIEYFIEQ